MFKVLIEETKSNKLAPLLKGNLRDGGFYPASMRMTKHGTLVFGVDYDGTQGFRVARGVDHVWSFPPELTIKEIRGFVKEIRPLLKRLIKGLSTSYNQNDYELYGRLDSDAEEAKAEIKIRCDELFDAVRSYELGVVTYDAAEFFSTESLDDYGLSETSSESKIRKAAKDVERHLRSAKIVINADVFQSMKNWIESEKDR